MFPLDVAINFPQSFDQLFLLAVFAENGGHLLAEGADDIGIHLGKNNIKISPSALNINDGARN